MLLKIRIDYEQIRVALYVGRAIEIPWSVEIALLGIPEK